jgi:ribonuclease HI
VVLHYLTDIKGDKGFTAVIYVERLIQRTSILKIVIKIYVDGGTRGMVICLHDPQRQKYILKKRKGATTNNDLEYLAIIYGIEYANKYYPRDKILILSDSKLAVNQINDVYRVNGDNLIALHKKVMRKINWRTTEVQWVRRNFNLAGIHLEKLSAYLRTSPDKLR